MVLVPDYLSRTGYRLPTESEWEFACRAGTSTSRYFGETETLLGDYVWYTKNSNNRRTLPVGSLLPNDLGFFDMNGNVLEWMQNGDYAYTPRIRKALDKEDKGMVSNTNNRLLRGGSFSGSASNVRSSDRYSYRPDVPSLSNGFRPSRTFR